MAALAHGPLHKLPLCGRVSSLKGQHRLPNAGRRQVQNLDWFLTTKRV
jgi:hypothetical protein